MMWRREVKCERGRTKGVARPQPRGDKGTAMREGCCVCKGAFPEKCELAEIAENTYYAREVWAVVQVEAGRVLSRPTAEKVGKSRKKSGN